MEGCKWRDVDGSCDAREEGGESQCRREGGGRRRKVRREDRKGPSGAAPAASRAATGCHSGSQVASLELCWNAEESAMLKAGGFLQTKVSKKEVDGCCYANWVTCGVGNIPSLAASSGVLSSLEPPLEAGRRSGAGPGWAFGPDRGSGGPISSEGPSQEGQSSEMGGGVGNGGAVGEDRARYRPWDIEIGGEIGREIGWARGEGEGTMQKQRRTKEKG